jgi:hypothetical protein
MRRRFSRRRFLLSALSATAFAPIPALAGSRPLWPGARYTAEQRQRAIERGLHYIYAITKVPKHFADYGADFLWCFFSLADSAQDPWLKQNAMRMGRERARLWRHRHKSVPQDADADDIADLVFGCQAADALGIEDRKMKPLLARAAAQFGPVDFLKFDPATGAIPNNIPEPCDKCATRRLKAACTACGGQKMLTRYEVLLDALITTWSGEHFGVKLGATFPEVATLVPTLRPYRDADGGNNKDFIDIAYCVTHIVYTLNDYGRYRLRPEWLRPEFEFLKANLEHVIAADDAETMGEFLDTLKSFGLTQGDPLIRKGMSFVLSRQHRDGGWGEADKTDLDPYTPYHATWCAINGLMDYAFSAERVSFPAALKRANGQKTG